MPDPARLKGIVTSNLSLLFGSSQRRLFNECLENGRIDSFRPANSSAIAPTNGYNAILRIINQTISALFCLKPDSSSSIRAAMPLSGHSQKLGPISMGPVSGVKLISERSQDFEITEVVYYPMMTGSYSDSFAIH